MLANVVGNHWRHAFINTFMCFHILTNKSISIFLFDGISCIRKQCVDIAAMDGDHDEPFTLRWKSDCWRILFDNKNISNG